MRQLTSHSKIDRHTLMRARLNLDEMPQRELARRAAGRLGVPNRHQALQQSLSRIERRENVALEPQAIEALAAVLGLRGGIDLTEPYRWVYRNTCSMYAGKLGDPITWLGDRLPVFSSAANAYEARGWVTFADGRVIPAMEFSHPHEVFYTELTAELGDDESRMVLDPTYDVFCELAGVLVRTP
jgi:hypothetical protein